MTPPDPLKAEAERLVAERLGVDHMALSRALAEPIAANNVWDDKFWPEGVTFTVYLPAVRAEIERNHAALLSASHRGAQEALRAAAEVAQEAAKYQGQPFACCGLALLRLTDSLRARADALAQPQETRKKDEKA